MAQRRRSKLTVAARGTLPRASLAAARETDEAFRAWQRALAERVELPAPASVIGEPVTVVDVDYAGNPRRGVIVRCQRPDGREYSVSVADVVFADGTQGARLVARYREAAPVLKNYISRVPITGPYFDVTPASDLAAFAAEAPRHPVFRIVPTTEGGN